MVVNLVKKQIKKSKQGQALLELLLFLPFILLLFPAMIVVTNSLNGGINQQKITRGYFYKDVSNNSMAPTQKRLIHWRNETLTEMSAFSIGWYEKMSTRGRFPISTCYKVPPLVRSETGEGCEDTQLIDPVERQTSFVRIYTVYGICGENYHSKEGTFERAWQNWRFCGLKQ